MRISDWSSDVCSSDLELDRAGHQRHARSGFGKSRRNGIALTPRTAVGNIADRVDWFVRWTCSDKDMLAGKIFRGGRSLLISSMRSEEHTSELQSLMRISYAVFCLKKKNIQKQT